MAADLRKQIVDIRGEPGPYPKERFYIEKVLKPGGKVAFEMVSDVTGQRLDKETKEVVEEETGSSAEIKIVPPPAPVDLEALIRKILKTKS